MTEASDVSRVVVLSVDIDGVGRRPGPRASPVRAIVGLPGLTFLMVMLMAFAPVTAAGAKKKAAPPPAAAQGKPNACGCYKDPGGACMCAKKGKCGCSGECEPRGCEEKRAKDMEREIKAETKRAQEAEKKQKAPAGKHKDGDDADGKGTPKAHAKKSDSPKE